MRSPGSVTSLALALFLLTGCSGGDDPPDPGPSGASGQAGSADPVGGQGGSSAAGAGGQGGSSAAGMGGSSTPGGAGGASCPTERASVEVSVDNDYGALNGTLELPAGCGPFRAVLFLAGSGPTDRDGNQTGLKTDCIKQLAGALADQGIASVRYDKRGVGGSLQAGPPTEDAYRFGMYVDDAVRWVTWMRQDARFGGLTIAGHSEGSLIGILASEQVPPDAFVSLDGAGRPAGEILREQLAKQLPADLQAKASAIIDQLEAGTTVADVPSELNSVFRPSVQPYLISWFTYDPAKEFAKTKARALIVQGKTDIQISLEDANDLAAARPDATLLVINTMGHVLKHATSSSASQNKAYTDPSVPLADGLVSGISAFVAAPP